LTRKTTRMPLRGGFEGEFFKAWAIYRPVGFKDGPGAKQPATPTPPPSHRLDESQPAIPQQVALLHCPPPLTGRLHFGTSGCNCKHVPHRKGDWQGLRFAPSALRGGASSSNDTRKERKKLQQVSGILVVANRKDRLTPDSTAARDEHLRRHRT
jgi:hypothetical protein